MGIFQGPSRMIGVCQMLDGYFSHGESVFLCAGLPGVGEKVMGVI